MAENIDLWSSTASSNATADSAINWAENQLPGTVNNSARSMMAALAKFRKDNNGTIASTGSSNAYLVTANTAYAALATGLTVSFKANFSNTGAATLTLTPNGGAAFAAKAIRVITATGGDSALAPGQIPVNGHPVLHYDAAANSAAGAWILVNPAQVANTTITRPLNIVAFGGVANGGTATAAAQAAYDAAVEGEEIHLPAGTWTFSTAVVPTSKTVTWIMEDGFVMSEASAANLLVGYENLGRVSGYPVHRMEAMRARSNAQETGRFITFTIPANTGTLDHEKEALFSLAVTHDDEQAVGSVYKAALGGSLRGYIASDNAHGRAFGANLYALIEDGGQGVICGCEIDVSHNSHENSTPFANDVKIGLNVANVGPIACTTGIEISGNPFWYGLVITQASIKNDPDARAIYVQDVFTVDRDGHATVGKNSHDRNVAGVEILPDGQIWQSQTGSAATFIQTATGTPGATTIGQIVAQQKNSAGTLKSFTTISLTSSVATAGAESGVLSVDGYLAGSIVSMLVVSGSRIGPGTDNVTTCGNPSFRYSTVYAGTGTINTSDGLEKTNFAPIDDRLLDVFGSVPVQSWQWLDAVALKGETARVHFGWEARELAAAVEKAGLDPWRYAPFCRDEIIKTVKVKRIVTRPKTAMVDVAGEAFAKIDGRMVLQSKTESVERPVTEDHPVFDADGQPVMETVRLEVIENGKRVMDLGEDGQPKPRMETISRQRMRTEPVLEEVEIEADEDQPSGEYRYGLRPDQCLVLKTAWLQREIDRLWARLDEIGA